MTVRRKRRNNKFGLIVIVILIFLIFCMIFLECRLKPVVSGFAEVNAKSMATEAINKSVMEILDETDISCEELETIKYSNTNRITSINSNTITANKLKSKITLRVQRNLSDINNRKINIPVGSIIGGELMQGRGFSIPLNVSVSGNINSDFVSEFEQGGINQTVHKLSVKVSADLTVRLPTGTAKTKVETSVLIGETVIVGDVPSGMLLR